MPIFRGMKRWGIILSGVLLSSLLLAACGENSPTILDPKGPVANRESDLFWFILIVATIVFVAVEGLLIYSIIRHRERPNSPAPAQIHGNNTLEIAWTVAPSIFLFAVLIGTIYTMFVLQQPKVPGDVEVKAVAHQWWWEFDYVNSNPAVVTADELHVPMGAIVQIDEVSNNVIHSFWIPELTGKTDDIPGHQNHMWFRADRLGNYLGECAEFCGAQHAHMNFKVIVQSSDDYKTWLSAQQQAAQASTDSLAVAGKKLFAGSGGCTGCHGIVGVNLKSADDPTGNALIGPNLTHYGSRRLIAGDVLEWDPTSCAIVDGKLANKNNCGLYTWLQNPQAVKPNSDMNIRQLSDTEITQLIAYLESLQ